MHARRRLVTSFMLLAVSIATALLAAPAGAQTADPDIQYEVLSQLTSDPLAIGVAPDGRIVWTQRDGTVWVLTPEGVQVRAAQLAVSANACPTCVEQDEGHTTYHGNPNPGTVAGLEEGGLHGLLIPANFAQSRRIYLYRSMPGTRNPGPATRYTEDGTPIPPTFGVFRLSTFVLSDLSLLDLASEEVILEVPVEWDHCCHYGGNLAQLPDGTILLSTGDDAHFAASSGYGARDHRAIWHNAELSSNNPGDRRGKVLRLMPDGSVPDGSQPGITPNPFVGHEGWNPYISDGSGTAGDGWIAFDPYVYALGFKQPWRGTVHPSGTFYIDDVGPDATNDDPLRGPRGFEEINVIPPGGGTNHGWPRCMADNRAYLDVNWETLDVGDPLDCSATALVSRPLPGAPTAAPRSGMTGSAFFYGRQTSAEYPAIGSGGLTAEPIAVYPSDATGPLRLPDRFKNRLIVLEWSRSIIYTIPTNADGSLVLTGEAIERVRLGSTSVNAPPGSPQGLVSVNPGLQKPIDGALGPDGALYILEYGPSLYVNAYSRVSRIKCAGCTAADPARNYGLPGADRVALGQPHTSGLATMPGTAMTWAVVAAASLAVGIPLRRRTRVL